MTRINTDISGCQYNSLNISIKLIFQTNIMSSPRKNTQASTNACAEKAIEASVSSNAKWYSRRIIPSLRNLWRLRLSNWLSMRLAEIIASSVKARGTAIRTQKSHCAIPPSPMARACIPDALKSNAGMLAMRNRNNEMPEKRDRYSEVTDLLKTGLGRYEDNLATSVVRLSAIRGAAWGTRVEPTSSIPTVKRIPPCCPFFINYSEYN